MVPFNILFDEVRCQMHAACFKSTFCVIVLEVLVSGHELRTHGLAYRLASATVHIILVFMLFSGR